MQENIIGYRMIVSKDTILYPINLNEAVRALERISVRRNMRTAALFLSPNCRSL